MLFSVGRRIARRNLTTHQRTGKAGFQEATRHVCLSSAVVSPPSSLSPCSLSSSCSFDSSSASSPAAVGSIAVGNRHHYHVVARSCSPVNLKGEAPYSTTSPANTSSKGSPTPFFHEGGFMLSASMQRPASRRCFSSAARAASGGDGAKSPGDDNDSGDDEDDEIDDSDSDSDDDDDESDDDESDESEYESDSEDDESDSDYDSEGDYESDYEADNSSDSSVDRLSSILQSGQGAKKVGSARLGHAPGLSFEREPHENLVERISDCFPEGLPKNVSSDLSSVFHKSPARWVRRRLTEELTKRLEAVGRANNPDTSALRNNMAVITGERGIGKSVVLAQLVQWARENDWIVFYNPDPGEYGFGASDGPRDESLLEDEQSGFADMSTWPSVHYEGMFDNTAYAGPILMHMRAQHGRQLNDCAVRGSLASAARYINERRRKEAVKRSKGIKTAAAPGVDVPPTLLDVLDNGLANPEDASTSVRDLREQLSLVDEYPVLFAIDNVNTLYGQPFSQWSFEDKLPQDMKATDLTLCETFMPFDSLGPRQGYAPKRGAVIAATTASSNFLPSEDAVRSEADWQSYAVPLGNYTPEEFHATMATYSRHGMIPKSKGRRSATGVSENDVKMARFATQSHPAALLKYIRSNFLS